MPRYLRWIAAATAGMTIQFAVQIAFLAAFVGVGNNREFRGGIGAFVAFAATIVNVVAALAVNDWLARRYPIERRSPAAEREDVGEVR
jgi:hypothetical protein